MELWAKMLAVMIVIIVTISLVTAYFLASQPIGNTNPHPTFSLSLSSSNGTTIQDGNAQIEIKLTSYAKNTNYTLNAVANSSDLKFTFAPATGKDNFTSSLTITAPTATPSNNYLVNVTATNGETTDSLTYILGVLNSKVSVSGKMTLRHINSPIVVNPINITFTDISNGATYSSKITNLNNYGVGNYYVSLLNERTYNVTFYYLVTQLDFPSFIGNGTSINNENLGMITVYAQVGDNSEFLNLSQD